MAECKEGDLVEGVHVEGIAEVGLLANPKLCIPPKTAYSHMCERVQHAPHLLNNTTTVGTCPR